MSNNLQTPNPPFLKIPNHIIKHSLLRNKYILPLYIYSGIHLNPNYYDIVDTNLSLISETFAPSNPSAPSKFAETLTYLTSDIPDEPDLSGLSSQLQLITQPTAQTTQPTTQPTQLSHKPHSISKTSRLQYIFLPRSIQINTNWTKLTYDEYFYILERIDYLNSTLTKQKYNTIELLNLYLYYKQRINLYSNTQAKLLSRPQTKLQSKSIQKITMHESLDTICANTSLSRNTLTKYTNQLIELGLISITKGSFNNTKSSKECNQYTLSDKWKEIYATM